MAEATSGTQIVDGAHFVGCAARRAVLLGLASAGAATLAGCGGDEPAVRDPAGAYDTTTQVPSESASAAPPPTNAATPGAQPTQKPTGAPGGANNLVRTANVPVGGGVVAGKYVVVQPQSGVFRAFDAACPHAGVTVDAPTGGVINCSGHGSRFRANDGSRISGPAERGLKQVSVKVQGEWVARA